MKVLIIEDQFYSICDDVTIIESDIPDSVMLKDGWHKLTLMNETEIRDLIVDIKIDWQECNFSSKKSVIQNVIDSIRQDIKDGKI